MTTLFESSQPPQRWPVLIAAVCAGLTYAVAAVFGAAVSSALFLRTLDAPKIGASIPIQWPAKEKEPREAGRTRVQRPVRSARITPFSAPPNPQIANHVPPAAAEDSALPLRPVVRSILDSRARYAMLGRDWASPPKISITVDRDYERVLAAWGLEVAICTAPPGRNVPVALFNMKTGEMRMGPITPDAVLGQIMDPLAVNGLRSAIQDLADGLQRPARSYQAYVVYPRDVEWVVRGCVRKMLEARPDMQSARAVSVHYRVRGGDLDLELAEIAR
jgi:hypothetical protein